MIISPANKTELLILVTALVITLPVYSANTPGGSFESCASLLPSGEKFSFELTGNIDTTGDKPVFKGNLQLGNERFQDESGTEQLLQPFLKCVEPLIK